MKTFKEYFLERTIVNDELLVLTLKSGNEISSSIKLMYNNSVEISKKDSRKAKVVKLCDSPIKAIEEELGEKLDINDEEIRKFLKSIGVCYKNS